MRAEVGLLTRNIKISGDMKNENDTYGGHIKAFYGNKCTGIPHLTCFLWQPKNRVRRNSCYAKPYFAYLG